MSGFRTIADVRRANREAGQHFFDRDTMRAFGSRVVSSLYAGRFFVTREYGEGSNYPGPVKYHVREAEPSGRILSHERFATLEDAREAARNLAREVRK